MEQAHSLSQGELQWENPETALHLCLQYQPQSISKLLIKAWPFQILGSQHSSGGRTILRSLHPFDHSDAHWVAVHLPAHWLSGHPSVVAQELQSSWTSSLDFLAFKDIPKLISNILFLKEKEDAPLQTSSSLFSASGSLLLCDWSLLGHDPTLISWVMSCPYLTWSDSRLPLLSPIHSCSATVCPWWWVCEADKFVCSPPQT